MQTKLCSHCNVEHPLTNEFWYDRKYYKECRTKRVKHTKIYNLQNRAEKTVYQNEYRKQNPEQTKAFTLKFHRTAKGRYRTLKSNAKKRGIAVDISLAAYIALIEGKSCYYCRGTLSEAGCNTDRFDNNLGYTATNIVACCTRCNLAKHVMSYTEFAAWIEQVYKNLYISVAESGA